MCELLGMECNVPTDIVFSFSALALRGGLKGPHADGWGLALYEGRGVRTFLEPAAAAHSPLARFVRENPIKTLLAIAHVRRRTRGKIALENTHPFVRELWGRPFVFAHNGTLRRVRRRALGRFRPIGTTDSEHAFCVLLDRLARRFPRYPRPNDLSAAVAEIGAELGEGGTFNFLLGDGRHLFARCATKLAYIVRKAPFGLATLADDELRVDFSKVTTPRDRVAVVATVPLTRDEVWTLGKPRGLMDFRPRRVTRHTPGLTGIMRSMPSKLPRLTPKQAAPADSGLRARLTTPEEDEDNAETRVIGAPDDAPATVRSEERAPSDPPPEEEWTKTSQNEIKITPGGETKSAMLLQLIGLNAGEVRAIKERELVIGRHAKCDISLQDPGVSRRHARIVGVPGGPYMIEDLKSTNGTFVDGRRTLKLKLRGGERIQIGPNVVFRFSFGDETEEALARKLYEASTRDPLTQCHSRRFLDERLEAEVAFARRHKSPLGAVMFDIDHFKAINDTLGHAAGDRVLREVGASIGKLIRTEDVFGRYGGEEFLVLVRGIKHKNVIRFAERVRHAIDELKIPFGNRIIEITVSLGVSALEECGKKPDGATLVALADARLYRAKRAGRNRTCGTGS